MKLKLDIENVNNVDNNNNNKNNAEHLGKKGIHLNPRGKGRLSLNFLKQHVEHVNESHVSSYTENEIDYHTSGKSENPLSDPNMTDENTYGFRGFNDLRNQNPLRLIIGHLNINSIRNKFKPTVSFINNNLDIFISETEIDETFLDSQFLIEDFSVPYRLGRTAIGRGTLLYIREDIRSKRIKAVTFDQSFERFL